MCVKNPKLSQTVDALKDVNGFISSSNYPWMCLLSVVIGAIVSYLLPLRYLSIEGKVSLDFHDAHLHSVLEKSVLSEEFRTALLLSVVISVPMFVDTVLDCFYPIVHQEERIMWYSKALLLTSITIPNWRILMGHYGQFSGMGYIFALYYSRIATSGCILAYASQIALKYQMKDVSKACLLLVILSITGYTLKPLSYVTNSVSSQILDKSSACARLLAYATLLHYSRVWIRCCHSAGEPITSCEVVIIVKLTAVIICSASYAVTALHFDATNDLSASPECICYYTYIQMFYTVIIMTIPGRIARYEVSNVTRAMRERQAFIRYISHEIRTPLNTVFLGLEFVTSALKRMPRPKGDKCVLPIIDTVSDVYNSCEVALSILNDLLTFDKMEGGKMTLELEYVNCCAYFSTMAKPFRVNAREKFITFTVDLSELSPSFIQNTSIRVDHGKMGQVIRNLISNALKFTPDGGVVSMAISHIHLADLTDIHAASIASKWAGCLPFPKATGVASLRDVVRVEIRDTGAGISLLNQTKLFGQYVQFNANKLQNGNGSGLGLWISKGITELHGGYIGVYSEGEGKGSTFHLELPVAIRSTESLDAPLQRASSVSVASVEEGAVGPDSAACSNSIGREESVESVIVTTARESDRGEISTASLSEGVRTHLQRKVPISATSALTPMTSSTLTPYPSPINPKSLKHNGLKVDERPEGALDKSVVYVEYDFSSGEEDNGQRDYDDGSEESSKVQKDGGKNADSLVFQRKHHSGVSSVSSHSSLSSRAAVMSDKASLFGLAELLKKSLMPKKNSSDFLASVHPFMVTSKPFIQSLPSSRNSRSSSKFPTRYTSFTSTPGCNTPHCITPGKYSSRASPRSSEDSTPKQLTGQSTPNPMTGQSTPNIYNSPFNSPRTSGMSILQCDPVMSVCTSPSVPLCERRLKSPLLVSCVLTACPPIPSPHISLSLSPSHSVLFADSWSRGGLSNSSSRCENLESIREQEPLSAGALTEGGLILAGEYDRQHSLRPERRSGRSRRAKMTPAILGPDDYYGIASTSTSSAPLEESTGTENDSHPRRPISPLSDAATSPATKGFLRGLISPLGSAREGCADASENGEKRLHFMIVDDVLMNRRMVRRFLSTADYIISEAKDGKDCLKVWEEVEAAGGRIDVVLMDNSMPVMTGPEAASEMRARGFTGIIIGVTGHAQAADIEDFERCGANAVLPKPLRFEVLTGLVTHLLAVNDPAS